MKMKREEKKTEPFDQPHDQERLDVVEMPVKITKVPAILAPAYDALKADRQLVIS